MSNKQFDHARGWGATKRDDGLTSYDAAFLGKGRTKYQTTLFPQHITTFPMASFTTCRYPEEEIDRRTSGFNQYNLFKF